MGGEVHKVKRAEGRQISAMGLPIKKAEREYIMTENL